MSKLYFLSYIDRAIELDLPYIVVKINCDGVDESIMFSRKDFETKAIYYYNNYDDNMCLKKNEKIKITSVASGTIEDILRFFKNEV